MKQYNRQVKASKLMAECTIARNICLTSAVLLLNACATQMPRNLSVPSAEYASRVKYDYARSNPDYRARMQNTPQYMDSSYGSRISQFPNANIQLANAAQEPLANQRQDPGFVSNMQGIEQSPNANFYVQESSNPNIRDYTGPLSMGEPGISSSLWRETRSLNLVRDVRAFQPMDLITIVVQETAEGKREADTDVKQSSTLAASIAGLVGLDDTLIDSNPQIKSGSNQDLKDILGADFQSNFKGEGETTRKGSLKGKISAMVVEVLPSGVLRVEGEKILAVNNEDEVMVISGLIRAEDVTSNNEVSSAKIANMRIDYYGQGTVGDAQVGGWFSRVLRRLWPL